MVAPSAAGADPLPTLAAARDQARLLHRIYSATLDALHDHYFHGDRAIVPARAMEDVFEEMETTSRVQARWISVNTNAMSVSHEPRNDFEKKAAAEISSGKGEWDAVEQGIYRRAVAIPLGTNCIRCHTGHFKDLPKSPRFAGLIISIPFGPAEAELP